MNLNTVIVIILVTSPVDYISSQISPFPKKE